MLNTHNPQQLIYETELLRITVLGGVRLEGLDRLRVTLKLEEPAGARPPVRHSVDLYNDTQSEKLIRKTAQKLEIGTQVIEAHLSEITEHLEQYRLQQIKAQEHEQPKARQLSEEERVAAEDFLRQPQLLERTGEQIGKSGVIGEEQNRLLMYLIFTSRKREQPLHVLSLGSSGTGKTHLQEKVGELIPEEDKIEITTLSENAFYYFGQQELKHKLILIEDLDGAENVLYPLRELQSKKRISKTIALKSQKGETKTINLVVEGPVSVAGCTTRESIYEDNANRSFLLYLDESPAQDERIMNYQRALSAGQVNTHEQEQIRAQLQNVQRILQPIRVVNPYAGQLKIPTEVFKPRRTNVHYLAFIEMITYYHQYQREHKVEESTGEIYIETTLEDIAAANRLMKEVLLRKSDQLTGASRNHIEHLKAYLQSTQSKRFTNQQISQTLRIPITTVKRYHHDLTQGGYLKTQKQKGSKTNQYEVVSYEEYEALQQRITSVLDDILQGLQSKGAMLTPPTAVSSKGAMLAPHSSQSSSAANPESSNLQSVIFQSSNPEKPTSPVQPTGTSGPIKPNTGAALEQKPTKPTKEKERNIKKIQATHREVYEIIAQQPGMAFSVEDIHSHTGRPHRTLRAQLRQLTEQGYLQRTHTGTRYEYALKS